jgi:prepilin-type N-terminal cleavage/methylation domain-containing protein
MNNKQQATNFERRVTGHEPRFGFTLVELVVAIGIMALVILFAGTIFKNSIGSYRVAAAQTEIMQKFRAITDQLNNDFRGLRKDAPMFIWFQFDPNNLNNRLDQIMFFADGDFQSTQTYNTNPTSPYNGDKTPQPSGNPITSNLARIYYGQARSIDPNYNNNLNDPGNIRPVDRILSRRQHLSIANPDSPPLYYQFPAHNNITDVIAVDPCQNNWFEHDTNSLSQWQAAAQNSTSVDNIITGCFNNRPDVILANPDNLHLLMTQKTGSFSVQWSYFYQDVSTGLTRIYWWPSIDPDGNGNFIDSDFTDMMTVHTLTTPAFGFYFNTAAPSFTNWFSYGQAAYIPGAVTEPGYPRALKFTFTLYDSRGVFKDGQTFTHIVYIGD